MITAQYKVDFTTTYEGEDYTYHDWLGCTGKSIKECNDWLKLQYEGRKVEDIVWAKVKFKRVQAKYEDNDWQTLYENGKMKYFEQLDLFETSQKED